MPDSTPIACLSSDWHLSHRAPACRAEQTTAEWYGVMANYIGQVRDLCNTHALELYIAGDIFDRPDNPAELVNFTMRELEQFRNYVFAVPGQHDLIHHSLDDIRRTSFWTLQESASLTYLAPGQKHRTCHKKVLAFGYPWGCSPTDKEGRSDASLKGTEIAEGDPVYLAVTHRYVWRDRDGAHPKAEADTHLAGQRKDFAAFDVVLSGDNHHNFVGLGIGRRPFTWYNPGTLIRRKQDEIGMAPQVGILMSDASVQTYYLDHGKDRFLDTPVGAETVGLDDDGELLKELRGLASSSIDFGQTLLRILDRKGVSESVRNLVVKCLEEQK